MPLAASGDVFVYEGPLATAVRRLKVSWAQRARLLNPNPKARALGPAYARAATVRALTVNGMPRAPCPRVRTEPFPWALPAPCVYLTA